MQIKTDITIIGAGLTGLALQYRLEKAGLNAILLEARNRLGGRIHTVQKDQGPPVEMGATWLGKKHEELNRLLKALDLGIFPQYLGDRAIYEPISTSPFQVVQLPNEEEPSYRIKGGSSRIIHALADKINPDAIYLGQQVHQVEDQKEKIIVKTTDHEIESKTVVSTLPPNLLHKTVSFSPALPQALTDLMSETHTWMGESIKFSLSFAEPFWREANSSGTVFSNVGPISEMYDHSNAEDNLFALKGFLNGAYYALGADARLSVVLSQLRKYYGKRIEEFLDYTEGVWAKEAFTYAPYDAHMLPHQNNGNAQYQEAFWEGRLFIAGSETAAAFPGYMEGAVRSAFFVEGKIRN